MGRNPIDRYLTTCAPPHTVADIFPRNCAEVRILQDADENDVPSTTTDIPPDATSSSSSVAGDDVPAAAPVEEPAGVPSQNEGGASPPAGSHGKTIVGYYAVSSPAYFIVRSFVRVAMVIVQHGIVLFPLHSPTTHYIAKSHGNGTTGTTKRRPRAWTLRKYKGVRFLLSLSAVARNSYISSTSARSCTVLLRSVHYLVNFAFFQTDTSGAIWGTDSWADPIVLFGPYNWNPTEGSRERCSWDGPSTKSCNTHDDERGLIHLVKSAGAEIYPSLGGWTLSDAFPAMAADSTARATFAQNCIDLIVEYDFDGRGTSRILSLCRLLLLFSNLASFFSVSPPFPERDRH